MFSVCSTILVIDLFGIPKELLQDCLPLAIALDWKLTVYSLEKGHSCLWQNYQERLFKGPSYLYLLPYQTSTF